VRRLIAAVAALTFVTSGCVKEETGPPPGDLDSIESTLNSVASEIDEP
jgi:hypothetical protein